MDISENIEWNDILNSVDWVEYVFSMRKFRSGHYTLNGESKIATELNIGRKAPTTDGWVGRAWCEHNGLDYDWPSEGHVQRKIGK